MSTDLNLLFTTALQFEKNRKWAEALSCYEKILKENPAHFESWLNSGAIYSQMKMFSKAIEYYQKSLKIQEDSRAFYNLGLIYYKTGNYPEAISQFSRSLRMNPDFVNTYLLMGYTYIEMKSIDLAIRILKDGLFRNSKNESLLLCLAIAYYTGQNFSGASASLNQILDLNEDNITALKMKAMISIQGSATRDSVENYRTLLSKDQVILEIESMIHEPKNRVVHENIMNVKNDLIRKKIKTPQDYLDLSLVSFFLGNGNAAMNYLLYSVKDKEY